MNIHTFITDNLSGIVVGVVAAIIFAGQYLNGSSKLLNKNPKQRLGYQSDFKEIV